MSNWTELKDFISRVTPIFTESDREFMINLRVASAQERSQIVSFQLFNDTFVRIFSPIADSTEATANTVLGTTRLFGVGTDGEVFGLVHVLPFNAIDYDSLMLFLQLFATAADRGEEEALGTDEY